MKKLIYPAGALEELEKDQLNLQAQLPPIIIGKWLLSLLAAQVGETIQLVSPSENSFQGVKKFKVVGTYFSGLKHYDDKIAFMSLRAAQKFFNMNNVVTGLEIALKSPNDSLEIADKFLAKYE